MRKGIIRSWNRHIAFAIAIAMVVTGCNVIQVKAGSADTYSNGFEEGIGDFKGARGAKVSLSSALDNQEEAGQDESQKGEKTENTSEKALLTKKVTMVMEAGGYTDGFVDLKPYLTKTTKEELADYEAIEAVISVDQAEPVAWGTAGAKLYFQPATTWSWNPGTEVDITANTEYTLKLDVSTINWGSGDIAAGAFGIQLTNFKEGLEVTVTVKALNLIANGQISSMAAEVVSGEGVMEYVAQYDCTTEEIDLTPYLTKTTKEELSKVTSIDVVFSVETAQDFTPSKTPVAHLYFMPNTTWNWATGTQLPVAAGMDITLSFPAALIKWGAGDTAVGAFGIQLNNFKEGPVKYVVKSVRIVTEGEEEVEDTKPTEEIKEDVAVKGDAKFGSSFLHVSERPFIMAGAYVDLTKELKAGKAYKITAWVKNLQAETDFIKLSWDNSEIANGTTIAAVRAVQGEWVLLEAVLSVPKAAKKVLLKLTTVNTKNDFGIDHFEISSLSKGSTTTVKNYKITADHVIDGKVILENKIYNNLTIDESIGDATVILNNVTIIGTLAFATGGTPRIELNESVINKFSVSKGTKQSEDIQSFSVDEELPTIVLGPGSSLVRFLAGADVELTQDERSVLEYITVNPSGDNGLQIVLSNVRCNLIVEADSDAPISIVLENSELNDVAVNSIGEGGQVDFLGDEASSIGRLDFDKTDGLVANLNANVQNVNVNANGTTINIFSKVASVNLSGNKGNISIGENAAVDSLIVNGNNSTVLSKGSLTSMKINGNNTKAAVKERTKVEIKKGASGSTVEGSKEVVDKNPPPYVPYFPTPAPTPEPERPTLNAVLGRGITKNVTARQDPDWPDANVLVDLTDYFRSYKEKRVLDLYERIEIKLTASAVTNYSETNHGKVTIYTLSGNNWVWSEYNQPELKQGEAITITVNTDELVYGEPKFLQVIGLKFSQYAPDTTFTINISSIKLIVSDTASDPDDPEEPDKATEDLVIFTGAQAGSVLIEDNTWSGVGTINLTSFMTEVSKLKVTLDLYDYIEVRLTLDDIPPFGSNTPSAKMYFQDKNDWKWTDGGDTAAADGSATTVRLPITKLQWGNSETATELGAIGLQIYHFEIGKTINYTVESIKLIAPGSEEEPEDPEIEGDYVELGGNKTGSIDLKGRVTPTKSNIMQYGKIKVVIDVNTILPLGTSTLKAQLFTMDNAHWQWANSAELPVSANSRIELELPTSSIKWGKDGSSTELGALGVQFFNGEQGNKVGYTIVSFELLDPVGGGEVPEDPVGDLTVLTAVTGSAIVGEVSLISHFRNQSVDTKEALSKYERLELVVVIDAMDAREWPGAQIYTNTNAADTWNTAGGTNAVTGSAITLVMPISSIKWGTETALSDIGLQFYNMNSLSYTIQAVKLVAPAQDLLLASEQEERTTTGYSTDWGGQADIDLSSFFDDNYKQKSTLSEYDCIEIKLSANGLDEGIWPGAVIYTLNDWSTGAGVGLTNNTDVTITIQISSINWSSNTSLSKIGVQIYNATPGAEIKYTIKHVKLVK